MLGCSRAKIACAKNSGGAAGGGRRAGANQMKFDIFDKPQGHTPALSSSLSDEVPDLRVDDRVNSVP